MKLTKLGQVRSFAAYPQCWVELSRSDMDLDDSAFWRVIDPRPGVALPDISPISVRARALVARRLSHRAIKSDFVRIHGVVDMLGSLDYHYANIGRLTGVLSARLRAIRNLGQGVPTSLPTQEEEEAVIAARYEAVAYVSGVGRLSYFFQSPFVREWITPAIPTIDRLLVFRHKVVAHRSIDKPKDETHDLRTLHALSLASAGGQLYAPLGGELVLEYQIQTGDGRTERFVPDSDHPTVMAESFGALDELLS